MAHESFESADTAAVMNELFVNIKVDREERPDIDAIYMRALHSLGEQGGWPLTMFLDSQARPFWGGTYFPPTPRYGRPGFPDVLREVARIYREEPDKVAHNAGLLVDALKERQPSGAANINDEVLADLTSRMVGAVDGVHGGLSGAPKFPQWSFFWLLWRGAIRYGHAPARQAVDDHARQHLPGRHLRSPRRRLCPLLGRRALAGAALREDALRQRAADRPDVRGLPRGRQPALRRAASTRPCSWLLREMIAEGGGFAASLDADSEGEEGKFYVWTKPEIVEVLGEADAAIFCAAYDVSDAGNWEGHTILNRLHSLARSAHRTRSTRSPPCAPSCSPAALAASAPAGTTRCWPTGTA